jgi:hypothetical protein
MNKIICPVILFFISQITYAQNLTLICDGTETYIFLKENGYPREPEKEPSTKKYVFKNGKLDGSFEMSWTKETIKLKDAKFIQSNSGDIFRKDWRLSFDRESGVVSEYFFSKQKGVSAHYSFDGKCSQGKQKF